ncbi:flavodoxin [Lacticigenium naphthae]|uniref:flavodoxin n=1 Tax=Lacticigenium naphthae TaxID=515351 RepID=UPI000421D674|nr:flavodoxin [Lacticigenium naphthae]
MPSALIVYASLTGNTEQCAEIVMESFEKLGVDVEMVESIQVDPSEFEGVDICVVGTYTYGTDANLPDEILDFYEELEEIDLTGKVFGTFGSGDTFYEKYCQSVDDFTEQFLKTGATQGAESVKVDLDPEEDDTTNLQAFAKKLLEAHTQK